MRLALRVLLIGLLATPAFAARVVVINTDTGTTGFNDATPATPVGGNSGTTRGQQRLIAVQTALENWGKALQSDVDIVVDAAWQASTCNPTSATLAFASTWEWKFNFEGAPQQDVLYPVALANKLAKKDLSPSTPDIRIRFNPTVDNATCLGTTNWYYGLDGESGTDIDLIATAMHELAHGLGFIGNVDASTGRFFASLGTGGGLPSIFDRHILDNSNGLHWDQMDASQRTISATNDQRVVWDGKSTDTAAAGYLSATPVLSVTSPSDIAKRYAVGKTTGWGGTITVAGITGSLEAAMDVAEPPGFDENGEPLNAGTTTDGCTAFSNAADIRGKFALIDRGRCKFVLKAQNAVAAGAIGVVIANNLESAMPQMGGDSPQLSIPVVSITRADGAAIRAALSSGVSLTLFADAQNRAGSDSAGHVKLYMPTELTPGSSMYHFDVSAEPNLMMEPNINPGIPHTGDLTVNQLADIGWANTDSTPTQPQPDPSPSGRRTLKRGRR